MPKSVIRSIPILFILSLTLGQAAFSFATDSISENYSLHTIQKMPHSSDEIGILFSDKNDEGFATSILYAYNLGPTGYSAMKICQSLTDPNCQNMEFFHYDSILQPCHMKVQVDCIDSFFARSAVTGNKIFGNVIESFPAFPPHPFKSGDSSSIPNGGSPEIYNLPGPSKGQGGENYLVNVTTSGFLRRSGSGFVTYEDPWQNTKFVGSIVPIKVTGMLGTRPTSASVSTESNGRISLGYEVNPGGTSCFATDTGRCAVQQNFTADYALGISIKLSRELRSWLYGRISEAEVHYSSSNGSTLLELEGNPVSTPIVGGWVGRSVISPKDFPAISPTQVMGFASGASSSDIEGLNAWMNYLGKTALGVTPQWNFRELGNRDLNNLATNLSGNNMNQNSQNSARCLKSTMTFAGMVSTNSTTYAPGPPIYNAADDSLEYRVLTPIQKRDGSKILGTYDLQVDKTYLECLYGHSIAPTSAAVSIIYEDASPVVSVVSVRRIGTLYHLSVKGFSYQSPVTLKVRFQEAELVENAPAPNPTSSPDKSPKPAISKKATIICVKGKLAKKVTSFKPSCPPGFNRK